MTYCAAINVAEGLVFISDSRTNAGIDNISTYSKMKAFGVPGERQFVICCAGNLATTQAVLAQVERDIEEQAEVNLFNVKRMADAASYIGSLSLAEQNRSATPDAVFSATFLVGGEIAGARCRAFMVYPEGNFISTAKQNPFLQIGETKYGKPIMDRILTENTSLDDAALCALLSMDATTRSNLSVGPPIELYVYHRGSLQVGKYVCFVEDSEYLRQLRSSWNESVREAFARLPNISWTETNQ